MPEATEQQIPKAANDRNRSSWRVKTPAAAGATKTSRFLTHWRGRMVKTMLHKVPGNDVPLPSCEATAALPPSRSFTEDGTAPTTALVVFTSPAQPR